MEWSYQAEVLRRAAMAVFEQAKKDRRDGVDRFLWVDTAYKYLAGIALENVLKAIMLRDDPCLVGKYKISDELKQHEIWSKYAESGQPVKFLDGSEETTASRLQTVTAEDGTEQTLKDALEQDEQDFLALVELYVKWVGRYPIAPNEEKFMKDLDIAKNSPLAKLSIDKFDEMFNNIYFKLLALAQGVNLQKL
jgi:hypothetical protein